jgi:hypothetical protein
MHVERAAAKSTRAVGSEGFEVYGRIVMMGERRYFVETGAFSSSNQFNTTTICVTGRGGGCSFGWIIRKRRPSAETS